MLLSESTAKELRIFITAALTSWLLAAGAATADAAAESEARATGEGASAAATAVASPAVPYGKTSPVVLGMAHRFESTILDEERVLNIMLPPSYGSDDAAERAYPVIYLLDGATDEDYHHVAGLVQFLTVYQLMPESILVGIANVKRYHDFSHPTEVEELLARVPDAGGSVDFIRFLGHEVQAYVDARFRTTAPSTLIGQSMGGLLASEIFIHHPDLFDQYIIVSPSLWWDDGSLIAGFDRAIRQSPERTGSVIVSIGSEGPEMQQGVDQFIAGLEAHAPESLAWHYLPLPDETHATILHRAIYQAFELLYGESHPGL